MTSTQNDLISSLAMVIGFSPNDIARVVEESGIDISNIDPDELADTLTANILSALREIDLETIVKDSVAKCTGMDREKWDAALSIDNEALYAEMLRGGLNAEVMYE